MTMLGVRILVAVVAAGLPFMQIIEAWDNWATGQHEKALVDLRYAALSSALLVVVAIAVLRWGWLA